MSEQFAGSCFRNHLNCDGATTPRPAINIREEPDTYDLLAVNLITGVNRLELMMGQKGGKKVTE
jgi:hypothetical protein